MPAPKTTKIVRASFSSDPQVCEIAKQSSYTRDFTSHRFFRENIEIDYAKGLVGVAKRRTQIVGYVYVKHLVRKPISVVHYMGVDSKAKGTGAGRTLLQWALDTSPHHVVELSCEHSNADGMLFYAACGLRQIAEGFYGSGVTSRPYTRWELK